MINVGGSQLSLNAFSEVVFNHKKLEIAAAALEKMEANFSIPPAFFRSKADLRHQYRLWSYGSIQGE